MNNEFTIFCGPMMSGKTTKLLLTLEKFKYQKKKYVLFKPRIDDRYSEQRVVTHGGWQMDSITISNANEIIKHLSSMEERPEVIAVDEAFMLPGVADILIWLYRSNFSVIVSTLDMSSSAKPFKEVEKMLPWATKIEKCSAVCTICGADAFYTHKKIENDSEIEVGGDDLYEARCLKHHANASTTSEGF